LSQNSARIGPIWGIPAETFFGVKKHVSKGLKQPMDAYDFFYETKRFSAQLAQTMWQQFVPKNTIEPPS
jgi:hypothetical protein